MGDCAYCWDSLWLHTHRCKLAQENGWGVMVSHRSGETEDTFIADLVVGLCTGQVRLTDTQSHHCVPSYGLDNYPNTRTRRFVSLLWWDLLNQTALPLINSSTRMEIWTISYSTLCRWRLWWHFPLLGLIYVMGAQVDITAAIGGYKGMLSIINKMHNSLPQVKVDCSFLDTIATMCQSEGLFSKSDNWVNEWNPFHTWPSPTIYPVK